MEDDLSTGWSPKKTKLMGSIFRFSLITRKKEYDSRLVSQVIGNHSRFGAPAEMSVSIA